MKTSRPEVGLYLNVIIGRYQVAKRPPVGTHIIAPS
jgi:hypothetical protein